MNRDTETNKLLFEEIPVPQAVRALAVPSIIAQLIILIYNMADTFFIGRVNNPMMVAGSALILPIFNVCIAVSTIAGTGGGTLIARLLGRGRERDARSVAAFSFFFSLFGGLLFAVGTAVFMHPLLLALGASSETYEFARMYASCVIVFGATPTILSMTMSNLLRNTGRSKEAGFGVSMGGVINIFLDPLFMFVLLPRGNEILGAGIATALSNCISCAYFLIVIHRLHSPILNFSPRGVHIQREDLRAFFSVGIPASFGPLLFDLDYMVINRLIAGHSDVALAAMGIVLKVERLPQNVGIGLCLGMVPLAAYNYSAGNLKRMEKTLRFTRTVGTVIGASAIVLYECFAPYLIRAFIADTATVTLGASFLRIRALATLMMFLCFIYVHFFQAVGHGGYAMFLIVLRWAVVNIPMLFLLDHVFGMYGVVWCAFVSDALVAFLSWLVYRRFCREHLAELEAI